MIVVQIFRISVQLIEIAIVLPWSQDPADGPYCKIHYSSYHLNFIISFIIVHLGLCLPSGLFTSGFSTKIFCEFLFCSQSNMCSSSHFDHPNNIRGETTHKVTTLIFSSSIPFPDSYFHIRIVRIRKEKEYKTNILYLTWCIIFLRPICDLLFFISFASYRATTSRLSHLHLKRMKFW